MASGTAGTIKKFKFKFEKKLNSVLERPPPISMGGDKGGGLKYRWPEKGQASGGAWGCLEKEKKSFHAAQEKTP